MKYQNVWESLQQIDQPIGIFFFKRSPIILNFVHFQLLTIIYIVKYSFTW